MGEGGAKRKPGKLERQAGTADNGKLRRITEWVDSADSEWVGGQGSWNSKQGVGGFKRVGEGSNLEIPIRETASR